MNAVIEREAARVEIQDVCAERDKVICLAKTRVAARIWIMF